MALTIYLLSTALALFAGYAIYKKMSWYVALFLAGAPILINGIDVFVVGDLTELRQICYVMYSFGLLIIALNYKRKIK